MTTTSSVATGTSVLDVATLVNSLMTVEQQPLAKLDTKINAANLRISSFGSFIAKASALQSALDGLAAASTFSASTASSSNAAALGVSATTAATAGTLDVVVNASARGQQTLVSGAGFASADAAVATLTVGGASYPSDGNPLTLTSLAAAVNAANTGATPSGVSAAVVKLGDARYGLLLSGGNSGAAAAFGVSYDSSAVSATQAARDAALTVNGIAYTRSSNTFADVLPGVTLTIAQAVDSASPQSARVTVANATASKGAAAFQSLVAAYNDLSTLYQSLSRSDIKATMRGPLNGESSVSGFMAQLSRQMQGGLRVAGGATGLSFSSVGIELQRDGTLSLNSSTLAAALAGDLGARLTTGLLVGAAGVTGATDLASFMRQSVGSGGLLGTSQAGARTQLTDLNDRRGKLSDKLAATQARYTAKYAALDAQLTTLRTTSNNLGQTLDSMAAQYKAR